MAKIDIITYASNYPYYVYDRFVTSLMKTGFSGKVHIIVKPNDVPNVQKLQLKYANVVYFVDENQSFICRFIHNHRFFVKKQYFEVIESDAEYFLLCDFRDVLFQKNIEEYPYSPEIDLYVFLEEMRICEEQVFNAKWIKQLDVILNEDIYSKISNNYVICSGATLGKKHAMKRYLEELCKVLQENNIKQVLDQGVHMYIIYTNKLDGINVKLMNNDDNLVNTIATSNTKRVDSYTNIVNSNNDVSYVVHQYDRLSNDIKRQLSVKHKLVMW